MFESYKLKKAKAKLELIEVNEKLNQINVKKIQDDWEQKPTLGKKY